MQWRAMLGKCSAFVRRHRRQSIAALGGLVLVIAVVVLALALPRQADAPAALQPEPTSTMDAADMDEKSEYERQIASGEMDAETLAGLTGEGGDLTEEDDATEAGVVIGMLAGDAKGAKTVMNGFGKRAEALVEEGSIDEYLIYTAAGDANQQVQDVRSMLNQKCKAIAVYGVDAYTFDILSQLAGKEGVAVVAIDAPSEDGFAVNIVADTAGAAAKLLAESGAGGEIGVLSRKAENDFFSASRSTLEEAIPEVSIRAYSADEPGYKAALAKEAGGLGALLAEQGYAVSAIKAAANGGKLPGIVAGVATAGFIKTWYALKNGGLELAPTEPTPSPEASATPQPTQAQAPRFTDAQSRLLACMPLNPESIGELACSFAQRLAHGDALRDAPCVYAAVSTEKITDDTLAAYYERYKDADAETVIYGAAENADLDAYFAAAAQATPPAAPSPEASGEKE